MGNYTILDVFENPRKSRQAGNFTTNVPKILDPKSSSEQIFSDNWRSVPLIDAKWPETPFASPKWHTLKDWQNSFETSGRFFDNEFSETGSYLSEI